MLSCLSNKHQGNFYSLDIKAPLLYELFSRLVQICNLHLKGCGSVIRSLRQKFEKSFSLSSRGSLIRSLNKSYLN